MTKKEIEAACVSVCRYYKGEKECPKNVSPKFWEYERTWVELTMNAKESDSDANSSLLGNFISDYIAAGLVGFEPYDGVPLTLKAMLFNRFSHWLGSRVDEFKDFYLSSYMKGA